MPIVDDLKVKITLEDRLTRGLTRISKSLGLLQRAATSTAGLLGIGSLTAAFTALSLKSIRAAGDAVEVRNRFEQVFGDLSNSANEFAEDLAVGIGRSVTEIQDGLGTFQSFAVGLGFARDQSFELSKKLQQLSLDFASFNNLSDGEAQQRFIAAMSGSGEVLDRFGINIKQGNLELKLQELGLSKNAAAASEMEKAIARLAIIEDVMGEQGAIGDAVRTADEFNAKMKQARAILIEFQETFGAAFVSAIGDAENFRETIINVASVTFQSLSLIAEGAIKVAKTMSALVEGFGALARTARRVKEEEPRGFFETTKQFFSDVIHFRKTGADTFGILQEEISQAGKGITTDLQVLDNAFDVTQRELFELTDELRSLDTQAARSRIGYESLTQGLIDAATATEKQGEESGKTADKIRKLTKDVIDFKRKQVETKQAVVDAIDAQRDRIRLLKEDFDRAVDRIKTRLEDLEISFERAQRGRRESFLLSIASQTREAERNIKEREELIEEELEKGEEADQGKVASLEKANEEARAILEKNQQLIDDAREEQAKREGARGIEFLKQRFEEESQLAREQFEKEKEELRQQLNEKEEEFRKSNEKIREDTKNTLKELTKDYLIAFDDLFQKLSENKAVKLLQQIGMVSLQPTQAAQRSLDKLLAGLPQFAGGGVVPGQKGEPRLVVAHGGERIIPNSAGGTINLGGITINNNADISMFFRELTRMQGKQVESSKLGIL